MKRQPKKIIISNPDDLVVERFHIGGIISDATAARDNMTSKGMWYRVLGRGCRVFCRVLTPYSTEWVYNYAKTTTRITTCFRHSILEINIKKI